MNNKYWEINMAFFPVTETLHVGLFVVLVGFQFPSEIEF